MKTKEKIIRKSINRIEKRLKILQDLFSATPVSNICEIRIKAQKLLSKNTTIEQRTDKDFVAKIGQLGKEERQQLEIIEKRKNMSKIIDEQVQLKIELEELNNELYVIEHNRQVYQNC